MQPCCISYGPPYIWNFQPGAAVGGCQDIVQVTDNAQEDPGLQIIIKEPVLCEENRDNLQEVTSQGELGFIRGMGEEETTTTTSDRKGNRPHPLAGREGEGPPIAPDGWRWRPGKRIHDMYFWSPSGHMFRSQVSLNAYLSSNPESPSPSQFRWNFSPTDYRDEELPGMPIEKKKRINMRQTPEDQTDQEKKKRKKRDIQSILSDFPAPLSIREPAPDTEMNIPSSSSPHKDIPSPLSSSLCEKDEQTPSGCALNEQTLVGVREPDYRLSTILASPNSHSLLADPEAMSKFIEETKKSGGDIVELRKLVGAIAEDIPRLKKHPKNVLQFFYYLIRDEEAPSYFDVCELSEICNRWMCKHQRTWCLREEERMRLLMKNVVDSESVFKNCKGDVCCSDANFCPGCNCTVCKDVVDIKQAWSYIRCMVCSHISHMDCAVRDKNAGVMELDGHFLCPACLNKTDLTSFCKARILDAIGLQDRDLMKKNLAAVVRVLDGVERAPYKLSHARIRDILSYEEYADIDNVLKHIVEYLDDSKDLTDDDEGILSEIVDKEVVMNENRNLLELKKKAEADFAAWMKAANFANSRRVLCELMTEQLHKAEKQARIKADIAAASKLRVLKSEDKIHAMEVLKQSKYVHI